MGKRSLLALVGAIIKWGLSGFSKTYYNEFLSTPDKWNVYENTMLGFSVLMGVIIILLIIF